MIKLRILFIFFLVSSPKLTGNTTYQELIVWNVGQGQWVTFVDHTRCTHFDMGGEFFPKKAIQEVCNNKINYLIVSHEDWDHMSFIMKARQFLTRLCFVLPPPTSYKRHTKLILKKINLCPDYKDSNIETIVQPPSEKINSNDSSHIVLFKGFLIPGDSSSNAEKIWVYKMRRPQDIRILVLGHHGSRTSTSNSLLNNLINLKLSISSSRFEKYGHPHPIIVNKMKYKKIPLLRTEVFGNFRFRF